MILGENKGKLVFIVSYLNNKQLIVQIWNNEYKFSFASKQKNQDGVQPLKFENGYL